jgi:hypothetical protein
MEGDTGNRAAVVFDIGRFVAMVRKREGKTGVFGMRLRVIPADAFFTTEDAVAVIEDFAVSQVKELKDARFEAVVEVNAATHETSGRTVGVETQC